MLRPFATPRPVGSRRAARPLTVLLTALVIAVLAALVLPRPAAPSALERDTLIAPQAAPAPIEEQAPVLIAVPTLNVNLRVGPSTATARRRVVVSGEPLVVVDQSRQGWVRVRTVEGLDGWVASQYVTYSYQATAPTVASVQAAFAQGKPTAALAAQPVAAVQPQAGPPAPQTQAAAAPASSVPAAPPQSAIPTQSSGITGIGDSIMLGSAGYLRNAIGAMGVNAVVGRQADGAIDALRYQLNQGQLGGIVLIHIGTNGYVSGQQFDTMMGLVGQRRVVFVNIRVPRAWEGPNNGLLATKVRQYPNASLVDWYSVAVHRPDFFAPDGVHLSAAGMQAYAATIAARLR